MLYKLLSYLFYHNKAQRKNFYHCLQKVGIVKYRQLKKVVPEEIVHPRQFKYNFVITAIAKNEDIYFKEWIEYHKLIGVEHFYIYNNDSDDNIKVILQPYIDSGLVTLTDIHGREQQGIAYMDAAAKYKNESRWMCFLDLDEFIVLKKHKNIHEFMANFTDCYQVSLHWVLYGSSGHIKKPEGLVLENFTCHAAHCSPTIKSIVNPRAIVDADPVHNIEGVGLWVNEHHNLYGDVPPSVDIAQINHYFVKSKEEFVNRKTARGSNKLSLTHTDIEKSFAQHDANDVSDNLMHSYVEQLKKVM